MKKEPTTFDKLYFSGLTEKEIISVYDMGSTWTLQTGEFLVREGEADASVYLVTSGRLAASSRVPGSDAEISHASFGPGTWVGDRFEPPGKESRFSYRATDITTLLAVTKAAFELMDDRVRQFIHGGLDKGMAGMVQQISGALTDLSKKNAQLSSLMARNIEEAARDYPKIEFIEEILKGLPRLPLFVDKLTTMLMSEKTSTAEIVEYAKADPSVVSTTLRRINSPFYNIPEKITDFHRAVMLLGFNQIYQIALEECVFETFPKSFRSAEFHTHSLLISLIGFELATVAGIQAPAAVSTVGLIHDIGQVLILLLQVKHREYVHLIARLNGSEIAAMLFEKWSFPPSMCGTIRYQPYAAFSPPSAIPGEYRDNVALLHVAHLMAEYMQSEDGHEPSSIYLDEYMEYLGLKGRTFKDVAQKNIYPPLLRKVNFLPEDIRKLIEIKVNR